METLRELRGTMIGTERGLYQLDGLPGSIEHRVSERINQSRRRGHVRQYLSDVGKMLREACRVLKDGGLAVLVVGPTIINTKRSDVCELLAPASAGAKLDAQGPEYRAWMAELRAAAEGQFDNPVLGEPAEGVTHEKWVRLGAPPEAIQSLGRFTWFHGGAPQNAVAV